ncbi:hypothetical protein F2Q70_00018731 [Brassica cretica]|uniref:Uncharacterized protein n=1 Tax=Brassica cretica TaxID=69181 RepID=A0A8S9HUH0_BRACR|nr:hypothetical protein F2Q70_00018731 [Brassica cretica]
MKCVAAAVSGSGGDPRVIRSCRVIKSGFIGLERSALSVVSSEVEVIVWWAAGDNDKSCSEAPEIIVTETAPSSLLAISALSLLYLQTSSSDRRDGSVCATAVMAVAGFNCTCFDPDLDPIFHGLRFGRMKCVAAAVSGRGGDPKVVRSCRVIKSGFIGLERSVLSVVSSEVEVIVWWAAGDKDKSCSEAPEVV